MRSRAVASGMARVLFRRSLITEQSARELDPPGGSEAALEIPSIYFALTRPHCLGSFINGDATPRSVREDGSLRACFSQRDTGLEKASPLLLAAPYGFRQTHNL